MSRPLYEVREYGADKDKVVFLLAGWKTRTWMYDLSARQLARRGCHCIVYAYAPSAFSPNVDKTVQDLISIRDVILAHVEALKRQGKCELPWSDLA